MKLTETKTNDYLDGQIEKISKAEFKKLKRNEDFDFDWSLEVGNEVYKIIIKDKKEILGLISLINFPEEFRIHINLIESSKIHRGKKKLIKNISGCLIAFTCQISFERGYEGFVSLTPKTELVKYYNKIYGFQEMGNQMAVYYELSNLIIQKYLSDEKI